MGTCDFSQKEFLVKIIIFYLKSVKLLPHQVKKYINIIYMFNLLLIQLRHFIDKEGWIDESYMAINHYNSKSGSSE